MCLAVLTGYAGENIKFKHITMSDGLSDNQINHITRDSQGFMWFSTSHGLNRYDGYTFKVIGLPDIYGNTHILDVQEDASGILWIRNAIGTYDCFDPRKETIVCATDMLYEKYGISDKISLIYVDSNKDLWIHTRTNGTSHYNFRESKMSSGFIKPSEANGQVTAIAEDRQGILRVYTNGFFDHIDRINHTVDYENDHLACTRGNKDGAYRIFVDRDEDYWIYNGNGINIYYSHKKQWDTASSSLESEYRLTGDNVHSIVNDRHGRVWIGIDQGGINIIDKKSRTIQYLKHTETDEHSLIENSVYSLYADSNGGIWAGTFKRGISYYHENLFKTQTDRFREFHNIQGFIPDVSSIAKDPDGNLYLGLTNSIIKKEAATRRNILIPLPEFANTFPIEVVTSILCAADGKLWVGTYQNGLLVYDSKSFSRRILDHANKDSYANRTIYSLSQDPSGHIWIGTWGAGLWGVDPSSGRIRAYSEPDDDEASEHIASICLSKDGNIYMGTPFYMLIYHPSTGLYEKLLGNRRNDMKFSNSFISHIVEDSRGLLWLCTRNGLNIYDRNNDNVIIPEALENSIIYGIVEDDDRTMWASTGNGIYNITVTGNSNQYSYAINKYCDSNQIDGQQFNTTAILKNNEGEIIAGGTIGISIVDPNNITLEGALPRANFTGLTLFNKCVSIDSIYQGNRILDKALNYTDKIKLDYDQNTFSVTFSAMNYSQLGKTGYYYMLEGFDSDWIFITDNKITYTNLAPGTYTLKVKTVNDQGLVGDEISELEIVIAPPFYKSWIAYILYAIILIGIILLVWAYLRHNELQKYQLMQIEQDAKQKHEINSMKLRFFTNISHDLRTPLTLILTPLEYVMERIDNTEFKEKLGIAHKNSMRLLNMMNQLLDFRKSDMTGHNLSATSGDIVETIHNQCNNFAEYSEQRNINLTFFSPVKRLFMVFDEDKINKIIMNLLSNAFKFTPEGGRVDVSLDLTRNAETNSEILEIKVADNGCGISDEHKNMIFERFYQVPGKSNGTAHGSGIGLNLVKEFVSLHKGSIEVHDNISKGSVFVIRIPVERVKMNEDEAHDNSKTEDIVESGLGSQQKHGDTAQGNNNSEKNNTRPSILLVDDNDDFRMFMKDCLKADYNIYDAPDGKSAWEMLPDLQPDIIVSDVMMPGMDGNELCHLVKNDIRTSHILVILLTARATKEHEQKGLEVGADDYITKPFNLNILTLRIKNLLQRRRDSYSKPMDVSPSKINITSLDEKLITKAIQYVEKNLSRSDLSVEELSGELAMSRVHFYKKLLSITGRTPIEFIRVLRLKRAAQLLRESQLNIAEVTYQTGFNNLNIFRKYFKAEFGMLPSEYQAKYSVRNSDLQNKI